MSYLHPGVEVELRFHSFDQVEVGFIDGPQRN